MKVRWRSARRHVGHVMYSSLKGSRDITVNTKQTNNTIGWTHEIYAYIEHVTFS